MKKYELFQFTPLREGRQNADGRLCKAQYFNSRPSARGDDGPRLCQNLPIVISIHAPPRGATPLPEDDAPRQRISIHAPPRGATGDEAEPSPEVIISIHAPPRGAT